MQTQISIGFKQILNLANQLPRKEQEKLIKELQKKIHEKSERPIGKYEGKIWMSDDFNEPLEDFKDYM